MVLIKAMTRRIVWTEPLTRLLEIQALIEILPHHVYTGQLKETLWASVSSSVK